MQALEAHDVGDADSFVVNLRSERDGDVQVASVELRTFEVRNRYSFRQDRSLNDAFVDEFAKEIQHALSRLKPDDRIVSMPEFEFATGDLIIGGLRILITVAENGTTAIMLRFRQYIGSIKLAFRFDDTMALETPTVREKIAVDVLQDILTPLFDLMSLDVPGMDEVLERHGPAIRKRLSSISTRKEEITFFSTLLQRYVKGCQQDSAAQLPRPDKGASDRALVSNSG